MVDGRVARRVRNQDIVLDAVVALFDAGELEPGVDEVSDSSGVSTRSIYRYFHHRDGLIEAALWHLVDRVHAEVVLDVSGGEFDERLRAFVEHRLAVFDRIAPLVRASKRLARPLTIDPAPLGGPRSQDGFLGATSALADVTQRSLFSIAPSVAFANDFARLDPEVRDIAAIAADVVFGFDTLDGLSQAVSADTALMMVVLERHLRQQTELG